MIRALLTLIALLSAAVHACAFTVMQSQDCEAAWQVVVKAQQAKTSHGVTQDGWCLVSNPTGVYSVVDRLEWRAEGLERVLQHSLPPFALAIRVTDADLPRTFGLEVKAGAPAMPMQITLSLRQNAQDKQVVIETLQIAGPKDNMVTLQGTFHDVDLSSIAKMQISLGSAKLRDVTVLAIGNRKLEPYLRPYIGDTFPERSRRKTAMSDKVTDWPAQSFPAATKRAIKQMIANLPAPSGTLRVDVDTRAGLSAALFVQAFVFGGSTNDLGARILDGTIFHASWVKTE